MWAGSFTCTRTLHLASPLVPRLVAIERRARARPGRGAASRRGLARLHARARRRARALRARRQAASRAARHAGKSTIRGDSPRLRAAAMIGGRMGTTGRPTARSAAALAGARSRYSHSLLRRTAARSTTRARRARERVAMPARLDPCATRWSAISSAASRKGSGQLWKTAGSESRRPPAAADTKLLDCVGLLPAIGGAAPIALERDWSGTR